MEDFNFEAPKTKDFLNVVKNLKVDGKKSSLVLKDHNKTYICARNIPGAQIITASDVNTYALLNNKAIILTEGCLEVINNL